LKPQQRKSKDFTASQPLKTTPKLTKHQTSNSEPQKRKDNHHSKTPEIPKTEIEKPKWGVRKVSTSKSDAEIGKSSSGVKKSQSKTLRGITKNSETASETIDAKPSEASCSLPGDEESKKAINKKSSLSARVELAEKELHAEVITSEGKSLSGNRESGSKSNSRSSLSTTRLQIPEKELNRSVSSIGVKTMSDEDTSEEKSLSSSRYSGNKLNSKRKTSLPNTSKTMTDREPSEEKSFSSSEDSGNKLNNRRISSLSTASKTMPDGKPSEEKSLSSSGDSGHKSNNRRKTSLSTARLEISENDLHVSVHKSSSKIMPDVNSSEKSLSNNGELANRSNNRRRSSFSAGVEIPETELHSSASKSVPSYMATTESAKARLRGQSSPRVVTTPDSTDKIGLMRRHSLPSGSANGKMKSISPRTQAGT
jgi:Protein of unknown function (DUF4005)